MPHPLDNVCMGWGGVLSRDPRTRTDPKVNRFKQVHVVGVPRGSGSHGDPHVDKQTDTTEILPFHKLRMWALISNCIKADLDYCISFDVVWEGFIRF